MTAVAVRSPVTTYAEDVIAGRTPAGHLVVKACERHLDDLVHAPGRGLIFDEDQAQWAIDFFPSLLKHSKGEWAGQPLDLMPWQQFLIGSAFGWMRADGTRRFRLVYIEIPRKNGKSTLAAGVGILLAFFDDEPGAEVYAAATKRDQAKIVWSEARQMVLASPNIRRRVRVLVANLNDPHSASKFEPLGADADSMDGLNIHGRIIDELHAHKTRAMWDVLETATGARRQPLGFVITTAGADKASVCFEQHEYAIKVLEGVIHDDTLFAYIATIDEGDDPFDPATWAKANPNLGISVKLDDLERKAKKAQEVAGETNAFLRLHLDVWTQSVSRWLSPELWAHGDQAATSVKGRPLFIGIDAVRDFASLVKWFPDGEGGGDALPEFFIPEELVDQMERDEGMPYREWARQGLIDLTDGDLTDFDNLLERVKKLSEEYDLQQIAIRRYNTIQFQGDLVGAGYEVVPFSSGFAHFAGPTAETERLLEEGKLRHGGHPVLRLMADNTSVRKNSDGDKRPDQEASGGRIGGMTALIMALGLSITDEPESAVEVFGVFD